MSAIDNLIVGVLADLADRQKHLKSSSAEFKAIDKLYSHIEDFEPRSNATKANIATTMPPSIAVFSTKADFGRRKFFFEVKATPESKPYIRITESSLTPDGKKQKNQVTIFENEFTDFKLGVEQVYEFASLHQQ